MWAELSMLGDSEVVLGNTPVVGKQLATDDQTLLTRQYVLEIWPNTCPYQYTLIHLTAPQGTNLCEHRPPPNVVPETWHTSNFVTTGK